MSGSGRIFAELDVEDLQSRGLAGPPTPDGTRRVHKRRLNRSSDEENAAIPLSISLQSPAAPTAFSTIPDLLISRATLVYLGFSEQKADALWAEWSDWPPTGPRREVDADTGGGLTMTFLFFITGTFSGNRDVWDDDDQQWRDCLDAFGMSADVQTAIMDPLFKTLRLTQSCAFWAQDTVEMRYAGLEDIQRASRERETGLLRQASRPGSSSTSGGPSSQIAQGQRHHERQRSASGLQCLETPGVPAENITPTSKIAARDAPGYTALYKGVDQARIHGLFDSHGTVAEMERLVSAPPSDFSRNQQLFYFSPDYKVAQNYAAYAKRRANCEGVVIVQVLVPNSAIEQLNDTELVRIDYPDPEWRELIYLSRRGKRHPSHIRKYSLATLIIGTIACKPNGAYHRMESWEEVDDRCVLRVRGPNGLSNAVQFVFSSSDAGLDFLSDHCAERISVLPYTRQEFEDYVVEEKS
ncbi:hypothetical protein HYQ45_000394 [Verticillium longisporum]|uniref:Uncharacterized protein n=1 Tax=Verticillium longisporum TaxID=100787 RepID=A0A8I3A187_VERLO|nr:hypothetical protein HYQ45_000394 [Verticillium longisporum]